MASDQRHSPGLSFTVGPNGLRIRQWTVAASNIKPFHSRSPELRHTFEDEFAYLVWSSDFGLNEDLGEKTPLYTLTDRRVVRGGGGRPTAWAWEYQGKFQDGMVSALLPEDVVGDSLSPLQLDVFHAMWEYYHGPDVAPRPPGAPSRGKREVVTREEALREFPLGKEVARELQDQKGNFVLSGGEICDICDPY